jgi:hypothetical protein
VEGRLKLDPDPDAAKDVTGPEVDEPPPKLLRKIEVDGSGPPL